MAWSTNADGTAANPQPVFTPAERDTAILGWRTAKAALSAAKETEMSLRERVSGMLFPNPSKGTQRYDLGGGYAVKLVHKLNYSFTPNPETKSAEGVMLPVDVQVEGIQDAIEATGNEGAFLADRLIVWKPSLSESEYNKLDLSNPSHVKIKALIDSILTIKPAAPTIDLEEPKAK